MIKRLVLLLFFISSIITVYAAPILDSDEEYLIAAYDVGSGGVEVATEGNYPLLYNSSANKNTEQALWIIKEEQTGKYSIKNVATNQYIKYLAGNYDTRYIELVNSLDNQSNTTLFTFATTTRSGIEYYAITSVADPSHVFNRRVSTNAIGTYTCTNRDYYDNELFLLKSKSSLSENERGSGDLFNYLNLITLNNKDLSYCKNEKTYFYSLPISQIDTDINLNILFEKKDPEYSLKIDEQNIENGVPITLNKVKVDKQYKIEILKKNTVINTEYIIFTGLPIVQLYTNGSNLSTTFSRGQIRVHDSEKDTPYELLNAEMRYRGAITLNYNKKSFSIKTKDENWNNIDKSYFGFREDKYWILDAMPIDMMRMRNRVATDLWNEFSSAPQHKTEEPEMINGTRGQFVEVFLDNQYWGIYCMTERIDRKQLKLKKYKEENKEVRGVLYKTADWSYSVMMGYRPRVGVDANYPLANYNNNSETWDNHEVKYPDIEDGEPIDWKPLYDVVKLVAHGNDNEFATNIGSQIDLSVWADYYLLMEMILAVDNHGKNAYLYMYNITKDSKLGIAVWDMDAAFGRRWNASAVGAAQNYTTYIVNNEHGQHNLFRRLKEKNVLGFNDLLKERYDKLRFTYFSPDNLYKRFEDYKNLFEKSGAASREIKRWNGVNGISVNFNTELNYLKNWLNTRSQYLNNQYGEPNYSSVENNELHKFASYTNPISDKLHISNVEKGTPINIYAENGICIYSKKAEDSEVFIDFSNKNSGCYFLKLGNQKGKVIVKK